MHGHVKEGKGSTRFTQADGPVRGKGEKGRTWVKLDLEDPDGPGHDEGVKGGLGVT